MSDLKKEIDDYMSKFASAENQEVIRHALSMTAPNEKKMFKRAIKKAEKILSNWFGDRLYSLGFIVDKVDTFSREADYGSKLGIAYSLVTKKDRIDIGRFLMQLVLINEAKEREIKTLKAEVSIERKVYSDMAEAIGDLVNREALSDSFDKGFDEEFDGFGGGWAHLGDPEKERHYGKEELVEFCKKKLEEEVEDCFRQFYWLFRANEEDED